MNWTLKIWVGFLGVRFQKGGGGVEGAVFPIWKSPQVLQKARIKIVARAIYTYRFYFLYIYSPPLLENKKLFQSLFSVNWTTYHCSMIYITGLL